MDTRREAREAGGNGNPHNLFWDSLRTITALYQNKGFWFGQKRQAKLKFFWVAEPELEKLAVDWKLSLGRQNK